MNTRLRRENTIKNRDTRRGITLLLVAVILSALLSISLAIFGVIFGQIQISGSTVGSMKAFYAADQGIERILYLDRVKASISGNYTEAASTATGGCFASILTKSGSPPETSIRVIGSYPCAGNRIVKRGFEVDY